jgi:peptidoglycan/xylan/chitin deacetylase (PgdA/CDA1 family)
VRADWFVPALAAHVPRLASAYGIECRLGSRDRVALTFDDGPHASGTPAVLAVLARHGAAATFFLVGEQVARYPSLAAEIAAAGHEIAIHGYRHVLLLRRAPAALREDLVRAHDVIASATRAEPTLYRPPYGVFSGPALLIARELGWQILLWSRWGRDWGRRATPEQIAARASRSLSGGDVVLLHDADHYSSVGSWRRTVAALPSIIDAVSASGESLVAASHST